MEPGTTHDQRADQNEPLCTYHRARSVQDLGSPSWSDKGQEAFELLCKSRLAPPHEQDMTLMTYVDDEMQYPIEEVEEQKPDTRITPLPKVQLCA